jgi:hypothetical protein
MTVWRRRYRHDCRSSFRPCVPIDVASDSFEYRARLGLRLDRQFCVPVQRPAPACRRTRVAVARLMARRARLDHQGPFTRFGMSDWIVRVLERGFR